MSADRLDAQTGVWNLALNYTSSMSLKCAIELGIPAIIHNHGQPISLPTLTAALGISLAKSSQLRSLMRMLTHSGIFSAVENDIGELVYSLTPLSHLLVNEKVGCQSPVLLFLLDPIFVSPFHFMAAWFRGEEETTFEVNHGCRIWEEANRNPKFNETVNAGMASDACVSLNFIVKECGHLFASLRSLVDVGGGTGSAAKAIAETFPEVKCSVLDLAHVVKTAAKDGTVEFISGDMFQHVPAANAVLLKWILHDWDDENSVKILQRCKEAIPSRQDGGKVIIVDVIVGSDSTHPKNKETQLYMDIAMMTINNGVEREEHEWRKIFTAAGYTDYKIVATLGFRSVIELYP